MAYTRNLFTRESKATKKKRKETEQLLNVISLRINDDEKRIVNRHWKLTHPR